MHGKLRCAVSLGAGIDPKGSYDWFTGKLNVYGRICFVPLQSTWFGPAGWLAPCLDITLSDHVTHPRSVKTGPVTPAALGAWGSQVQTSTRRRGTPSNLATNISFRILANSLFTDHSTIPFCRPVFSLLTLFRGTR
jgi:hypothetical protein